MFNRKTTLRFTLYILGMVVLALGISLNARTSLGVSPIVSVAYTIAALTGVGAALSLNMRIIHNPGDGIVQTIGDATGRNSLPPIEYPRKTNDFVPAGIYF